MSKHTPGPWRWQGSALRAGQDYVLWIANGIYDSDSTVERMGACGPSTERAAEANARLIASAPDLLEALRDIVEGTRLNEFNRNDDGLLDNGRNFDKRLKAARAAINKATGESK